MNLKVSIIHLIKCHKQVAKLNQYYTRSAADGTHIYIFYPIVTHLPMAQTTDWDKKPLLAEGKRKYQHLTTVVYCNFYLDLSPWHAADRKHSQIANSRCGSSISEIYHNADIIHWNIITHSKSSVDLPVAEKTSWYTLSRDSCPLMLKILIIQQTSLTRRKPVWLQKFIWHLDHSLSHLQHLLLHILNVYPAVQHNCHHRSIILQPNQI